MKTVTLHENYYYSNKIFNPMSERRCPPDSTSKYINILSYILLCLRPTNFMVIDYIYLFYMTTLNFFFFLIKVVLHS